MSTPLADGGTFHLGSLTQNAGTKIVRAIWPKAGFKTVINYLRYISAGTQHTITLMRPIGETTLTAAVAAGASYVLPVTADPGAVAQMKTRNGSTSRLAANAVAGSDRLIVALPDGTYYDDTVTSVASLNVTMDGTLPTNGAASGAKVWNFGVEANSEPWDAAAHATLKPATSATTTYANEDGIFKAGYPGQPILIIVDNGTAAGTLEAVCGYYTSVVGG